MVSKGLGSGCMDNLHTRWCVVIVSFRVPGLTSRAIDRRPIFRYIAGPRFWGHLSALIVYPQNYERKSGEIVPRRNLVRKTFSRSLLLPQVSPKGPAASSPVPPWGGSTCRVAKGIPGRFRSWMRTWGVRGSRVAVRVGRARMYGTLAGSGEGER